MQLRGQHVVLGLLLAGLCAAAFAWWFQRSLTDQVLALWGPEVATALRAPDKLELLLLAPAKDPPDSNRQSMVLGGTKWEVHSRHDITAAPGVSHAGQALLENASFDFAHPPAADRSGLWTHALVVTRGATEATLALDFAGRRVRLEPAGREAALGDRLIKGLPIFFEDVIEREKRSKR